MTDPEPGVAIEAPLSPAEDESETTRHGLRRTQREILPAELEGGEDGFAPVRFHAKCRDQAGYLRREHCWDRDDRCVFCSRRRTGYPPR